MQLDGVPVELVAEIGLYGFFPRPGEPFIFSNRNISTCKALTTVETVLGLHVSGRHNRCLAIIGAAQIDVCGNINSTYAASGKFLVGSGGANDIASAPILRERISQQTLSMDWSFESLKLFKNASRNRLPVNGSPPRISTFGWGLFESSLSRPFADFLVHELDLTEFNRRMELTTYGADEQSLSTLNIAEALQAPGGYTSECVKRGKGAGMVTRFTFWSISQCEAHLNRHGICVLGLEDLAKNAMNSKYLYFNKMVPDQDFGAISCWYETMFNRTYLDGKDKWRERLDEQFYTQLPHVRYQSVKAAAKALGTPVNISTFNCSTS